MTGMVSYELRNGEIETVTWGGCFGGVWSELMDRGAVRCWYTVDGSVPDTSGEPDIDLEAMYALEDE